MTRVFTPDLLQHVLEGQRVDHRGQHAHVVGGDPVEPLAARGGAADDVAAADHERELHAERVHRLDLFGEGLDHMEIEAEALSPASASPDSLSRARV